MKVQISSSGLKKNSKVQKVTFLLSKLSIAFYNSYNKLAIADINDLKVFVDLASISAGENDMDVDRVACFHDAVLGYSSMLYDVKNDSDFKKFNDSLSKLWKALGNDRKIPKKLVRFNPLSYTINSITTIIKPHPIKVNW